MTDTKMLRQKIEESGYKLQHVASCIGLTYAGLQKKLNNESEFKQTEISGLRELLHLSNDDCNKIFFS